MYSFIYNILDASKNSSSLHKSVNEVTVNLSSVYIKKVSNGTYIYGNIFYINWITCHKDKYKYKIVCLSSSSHLTINYYTSYDSNLGHAIACEGSEIIENRVDGLLYFGCAIMYKNNNSYIASSQIKIQPNNRLPSDSNPIIILKDIQRIVDRNESRSHIVGKVHYKNFADCDYSYRLECYGSYDNVTEYAVSSNFGISQTLHCDGNEIDYSFTGEGKKIYFGCIILSKDGSKVSFKSKRVDKKIDILFLYKMFGYSLLANVGAIVLMFCCALR